MLDQLPPELIWTIMKELEDVDEDAMGVLINLDWFFWDLGIDIYLRMVHQGAFFLIRERRGRTRASKEGGLLQLVAYGVQYIFLTSNVNRMGHVRYRPCAR